MPSIRTLKTFLAAARTGTFAAAGSEVGLTAAAVGLQIRTLEEELNQVLFDRGPRSMVLNPTGRKLLPQIAELVGRYEQLLRGEEADALSGTVVMGALVSALMGAFADALWSLKQDHPGLRVQLFAGLSSHFAVQVEEGELDAAIVTQSPRTLSSRLLWTPLYSEPMVMIVPKKPHFDLPARPLDILRKSPFIRFDRQTWTGDLVNEVLHRCKVDSCDEMELNSVEAIIEIVRQGFGISIVPQLANVRWAKDPALEVVALPGIRVQRRVGLLERRQHNRLRFTAAIKDYFDRTREGARPSARAARSRPV